jgi:hypothetical protein
MTRKPWHPEDNGIMAERGYIELSLLRVILDLHLDRRGLVSDHAS